MIYIHSMAATLNIHMYIISLNWMDILAGNAALNIYYENRNNDMFPYRKNLHLHSYVHMYSTW